MKIKEVTVTVKSTINLGNYSNVVLESSVTAELESTDSLDVVQSALFARCRNSIAEELANQVTLATTPNNVSDYEQTIGTKALSPVMPQWTWLKMYAPYLLDERFGSTAEESLF